MDPLIEEEYIMEPDTETSVLDSIWSAGPVLLGSTLLVVYIGFKWFQRQKANSDIDEATKNPDLYLARMEAIQRTREKQQRELEEASRKKKEEDIEKEKRKRAENLAKLEKYGSKGGQKVGHPSDGEYLPLCGGSSSSSYKAPKRSACAKGGCGK
ncbi:unnamed protein product [Pieris macdunnoughi]|uniref:Selenoprotein S n=1 Tax=Pieris macdunnoughi TaxID=345717 RepID=A0A821XB52_9NEOP|nr:unnamed protein product [Pieris macdunnoughi]